MKILQDLKILKRLEHTNQSFQEIDSVAIYIIVKVHFEVGDDCMYIIKKQT